MQRAACGEREAVIQERQRATGWRSPGSLLPADDFAPRRAIALYDGFLDQEGTRAFLFSQAHPMAFCKLSSGPPARAAVGLHVMAVL